MRSNHAHRSERLTLRLSQDEAERIAAAVAAARVTLSEWSRAALSAAADRVTK